MLKTVKWCPTPFEAVEGGAGVSHDAGEDVDAHGEAVALVGADLTGAAERQHEEFFGDRLGLHDRGAVGHGDPAGQQVFAEALGEADLVAGDAGHGGVEDEGRFLAGGRGDRERVEADHRLGAVGGGDHQAADGHGEADHVVGDGHGRVVGGGAEVASVVGDDGGDAHLLRLVDGELHGLGADGEAEAAVAVDRGGGWGVALELPLGGGIDVAALQAGDVGAHHVGDAVRVDAAEVGVEQGVG